MQVDSQCDHCSRRIGENNCFAFPDGIPSAIKANAVDHRTPVVGDHGLRWNAIESEKTPYVFTAPKLGDFS